jgi:RimJ/RimL family protein N-acetyltransferase
MTRLISVAAHVASTWVACVGVWQPVFGEAIMEAVFDTPRLTLREMSLDDLDFVAAMLAHPEVMRYFPRCYTCAEANTWLQRQQERYKRDGHGYWVMFERATGQPVGQAGLMTIEIDGAAEVGLGYLTHRPYWRQGFATEAAGGCLDFASRTFPGRRVLCPVRPENEASKRVAVKLGMTLAKRSQFAGYEHLIFVSTPHAGGVLREDEVE